jgi:hypothetical protein
LGFSAATVLTSGFASSFGLLVSAEKPKEKGEVIVGEVVSLSLVATATELTSVLGDSGLASLVLRGENPNDVGADEG